MIQDGRYEPRNIRNSSTERSPIHLIEGSNNLGAAVELAAAATIVRQTDGQLLTDQQKLIRCSDYGIETRNSDPHIGAEINSLARERVDITLSNPPGVYIDGLSTAGWETPDGAGPHSFWEPLRGSEGHWRRAVYEVLPGRPWLHGQRHQDRRRKIQFGAQIADFVTIRLTGTACRIGKSKGRPLTQCKEARH